MADSTDPQLIAWDNDRYRTLCDATEIYLAKLLAYQTDYAAQGIAAKATVAAVQNIADGYATDGRQPVTGTNIINFKAAVDQAVTAMNTTLITGVGTTIKAQADVGQVNGSPR